MNEISQTSGYEKPETKKHDAMNTVQGSDGYYSSGGGLYYSSLYYTSLYYKLYYTSLYYKLYYTSLYYKLYYVSLYYYH